MAEEAKHLLDDEETYSRVDPSGLRHRLRAIPGQCLAAWQSSQKLLLPGTWPNSSKVVVGGMGGSAMAGDLAADLAAAKLRSAPTLMPRVPILVVRDLSFPFSLDQDTIFIASSYSGNTEETLALFDQALAVKARTIAISSGGKLSQRAQNAGVPLLKIDVKSEPRTAVAYNIMLILGVLRGLRLLDLDEDEATGAISAVYHNVSVWAEDVPVVDNPAKRIALELMDKLIIVYGSGFFSGMARRWKSQFNENAKIWSFYEVLPESLHNSVEAFASPIGQPAMALILDPLSLDDLAIDAADGEPGVGEPRVGEPRVDSTIHKRHNRVILQTLTNHEIPRKVLRGDGSSPLARILNMLLLGDYVSYYLALLSGVDPSPNPSIDAAKELLLGHA